MYNILPAPSEKIRAKTNVGLLEWLPAHANPATATISKCLQAEFTILREDIARIKINELAKREPNFVPIEVSGALDPSPISEETRGMADEPIIAYKPPQLFPSIAKRNRTTQLEKNARLVAQTMSALYSSMNLFVQRQASMSTTHLSYFKPCIKYDLSRLYSHIVPDRLVSDLHCLIDVTERLETRRKNKMG
jgi:hypothetical protein